MMGRRMHFLIALSSLLCLSLPVACRKLLYQSNPGCKSACPNSTTLASVQVGTKGTEDHVTYLWSSVGTPGLVVGYTPAGETVKAEWSSEEPTSVSLSRSYSMAVLFTRLLAMNKTEFVPGETPLYHAFNLTEQPFYPAEMLSHGDTDATVKMSTHLPSDVRPLIANFSLKFSAGVDEGRESLLPRLKYTENSTRIEVAFDGWKDVNDSDPFVLEAKNVGLNFVLEVLLVPDPKNPSPGPFKLTSGRSLDDEYTPSQFWHSVIQKEDGFVYWKPIVYTSLGKRTIANSVPVDTVHNHSGYSFYSYHEFGDSEALPHSIASLLYGDHPSVADNAVFFYLSFNATQETAQVWNAVIGVGTPPSDEISLTVILIIALGLGIPGVVLIFGVPGATLYKRFRGRNHSGYQPIQ